MSEGANPIAMVGSLVQGIAGYSSGMHNAKAYEAAALDDQQLGVDQEAQLRDRARLAIGGQVAAQISNGFQGGTGSAIDALRQSQVNAAMDALTIRREAAQKSAAHKAQASGARTGAYFGLASGILGAAATAYQGGSDWAAAQRGMTSGGGGGGGYGSGGGGSSSVGSNSLGGGAASSAAGGG